MFRTRFIPTAGLILLAAFTLFAQEKPKTDNALPPATPATVGQEMFHSYCASCHGLDGKGGGPAAPALKNKPPDLTQLNKRYGKFPSAMVASVIQGDQFVLSHGSREMPIWGEAFRNVNADQRLAKLKVQNLAAYIESIQQK